ncbi:MAG: universal stress protein [Phenylobacterium sp.]|uniref:universal stress protein n=1 Tax=Phenylobacterium sp. TaxID=1871053 RepID=UPI002A371BDB|nr:universal stress protein [Phenylobacterium sp.]MDX9997205.1 universal stress protein [Phenylobacterium sp.]
MLGYREVLVLLDRTEDSARRLRLAAALAARFGAELQAGFPVSEFLRFFSSVDGLPQLSPEAVDALLNRHGRAVAEALGEARARFEAAVAEAGVAGRWIEVDGDEDGPLLALTQGADLVVAPRELHTPYGENKLTAAQIGMACGGPLLVVPPGTDAGDPCRKMLIAWSHTRESARLLRDAWPFVEQAASVAVVTVGDDPPNDKVEALRARFARRGQTVELICRRGSDWDAPDIVLAEAEAFGADLLAAGLYARPRLQQLLLGGMSRELLSRCPVPLLVSR